MRKPARVLGRRQLLKNFLVGSVVAGAGGGVVAREAIAGSVLTVDVAFLADSFRLILAPGARWPDDLAGSTFLIEGDVYPEGTIPAGDGFDPRSASALGRVFERGWGISRPERPQPAGLFTHTFVWGGFSWEHPSPPDQIVTSGMTNEPSVPGFNPDAPSDVQAVIGGVGRYAGASGEVRQTYLGHNTTTFGPAGLIGMTAGGPGTAPNFRFTFNLA